MSDDAQWMREAIRLSIESVAAGGGPFGAVVVRDGAIIGRGSNRVTLDNDPTAHAEVVAIREACRSLGHFSLTGCSLYASCEPCPMCLGAILWSRVDRLYYAGSRDDAADIGFDDAAFYRELVASPVERTLPTVQLLRDDAQAGFTAWREMQGRLEY